MNVSVRAAPVRGTGFAAEEHRWDRAVEHARDRTGESQSPVLHHAPARPGHEGGGNLIGKYSRPWRHRIPLAPFAALVFGMLLLTLPAPAAAALRALVIGVNAYQFETPLAGAVNDADSVAAAVAPLAASVTRLTDGQVRRQAVLDALNTALKASARGDTLLITYSGHGGRERVRATAETPTGYREFWVMADFNRRTAEGTTHRVLSTEIGVWLERARAAGVRVVLLADHCYAGKIYRSIGVDTGNIRSIPTMTAPDVPPNEPAPRMNELTAAPPPPGLVSLAADTSDKPVAEFRISGDNRVHGALSFAFAHALTTGRGDLDPQKTGRVTVGALQTYLGRAVNLMSDGQQYAQLRSGEPEDAVLFTLSGAKPEPDTLPAPISAPAPILSPAPVADGLPVLALHVSGLPAEEARALTATIPGTLWAPEAGSARLVWEHRAGASPLVTGMNMFVRFDLARADLAAAVRKVRIADGLAERAVKNRLTLAVAREDGQPAPVYFSGDTLTVTARALPGPYLAVFNLTATGTVQILYPRPGDGPVAWPSTGVNVLRTRVAPDYGGDHVIAVAGARPFGALIAALNALDGRAEPQAAREAVLAALAADPAAEIAVAALFTADRSRACDPEIIRDASMAAKCPGVSK